MDRSLGAGFLSDAILILDDDPEIPEVLVQYLRDEGYNVDSASSPGQALERLEHDPPAVLITDIKMPEMSGIEVVKAAKKESDTVAIIVLTALVDVSHAIDAMRAGADDYLLKPFNLNEISIAIEKAIEKRALLIENRQYRAELETRVESVSDKLADKSVQLRETKEYLESLLHSTVDAILTTDKSGAIEFANTGATRMLGMTREELQGMSIGDLYVGGIEEARYVRRIVREDKPVQNYNTEFRHKDGRLIPISMSVSLVRRPHDDSTSVLLICKDVTDQRNLEKELKEMSIRDSLSGLYNQRYFYERIESEIERAKRQNHPLSLLLFDIDSFKQYNDTHGHLDGDNVIREVGRVINECTREHVDLGFRYGGDEFTVLLPEADEAQALHIAKRIQKTFEERRFDHLTVSIGLMTYKEGYSLKSFIQFTDSMMYDAKRAGGNRVYIYDPARIAAEEEEL